jgi:hypothetical protein
MARAYDRRMDDKDIWGTVSVMIRQHGDQAQSMRR